MSDWTGNESTTLMQTRAREECQITASKFGIVIKCHHNHTSLAVKAGLLMYGQRMVIPTALWAETLSKLRKGHQGIVTEVLSTSKDLSMVAWYLKTIRKLHWEMSWDCQRCQTSMRTPYSDLSTLISLAKGGCRYLHSQRTGVFDYKPRLH